MIPARDSRFDIVGRRRLGLDEQAKLGHWCALRELQRTNGLLTLRGAHRTGKVAKLIDLYSRLNSGVSLTRYARP
jgi:hypothetical protein